MRKSCLILLLIFIIFVVCSDVVYAEEKDLSDFIDENIDSINTDEIDNYISNELKENISIKDYFYSILNGQNKYDFSSIINKIIEYLKESIVTIFPSIIMIIFISMLYSILSNMTSSFLTNETNKIVYFVCFSSIILIITSLIFYIVNTTSNLLLSFSKFMELTFPILLSFIIVLGGGKSEMVFKPHMGILTNTITQICIKIAIPLLVASIVILIVSNLSDRVKLNKLSKFFITLCKWILLSTFSIFVMILSFQGLTSGVIDTITIKTAKGAINNYVPILGEYISEGYDLIVASIVLIKNTFGYIMIIFLFIIMLYPVVKIVVLSMLLKLTAAIIEPISDSKIPTFLTNIGSIVNMLIAIIVAVFSMFIITVMLIIFSLNLGAV